MTKKKNYEDNYEGKCMSKNTQEQLIINDNEELTLYNQRNLLKAFLERKIALTVPFLVA